MTDTVFPRNDRTKILLWVILATYLPFLVLHFTHLWQKTHYQYFPLLIAVIVYLAISRWRQAAGNSKSDSRPFDWLTAAAFGLSMMLLIAAVIIYSPWLGAVSFIFAMGGMARYWAREGRLEQPFGVWCLLWLLIPLPMNYDIALIQWLQGITTKISSRVLDLAGQKHLAEGNVLAFPNKDFFVDEACSGVMSLMTLIATTAVLAAWRRRGLCHSGLLLLSGMFWACFMNVIRIGIVGFAWFKLELDLSSGWMHDVLGMVLFLCGYGLAVSTDALLHFLLKPIDDAILTNPNKRRSPLAYIWNRISKWRFPEFARFSGAAVNASFLQRGRSLRVTYSTVLVILAICQLGLIASIEWSGRSPGSKRIIDCSSILSRDSLKPAQSDWKLVDFHRKQRSAHNIFGMYSLIWTFQSPHYQVLISLDYSFPEWHELPQCYKNRGWELDQRLVSYPNEWGLVESRLRRSSGEKGFLLFSLFTGPGEGAAPPDFKGSRFAVELLQWRAGRIPYLGERLYQAQAWVVDGHLLGPDQQEEIRQEFLHLREFIRQRLAQSIEESLKES